ncbi:hypothetical protein ACFL3V_00290 [Nanoarchaeota archaeon]
MKKRCILISIISLLLVSLASSAIAYSFETKRTENIYDVDLGSIMFENDILRPGDTAALRINLAAEDETLFKVRISLEIWELGIYETAGPTKYKDEPRTETLYFDVPLDTVPGIYDVRITVEDSKREVRRVKYRDLLII